MRSFAGLSLVYLTQFVQLLTLAQRLMACNSYQQLNHSLSWQASLSTPESKEHVCNINISSVPVERLQVYSRTWRHIFSLDLIQTNQTYCLKILKDKFIPDVKWPEMARVASCKLSTVKCRDHQLIGPELQQQPPEHLGFFKLLHSPPSTHVPSSFKKIRGAGKLGLKSLQVDWFPSKEVICGVPWIHLGTCSSQC